VSGRLGAILGYLETLQADVKKLPRYYPPDALMERVRVRVRVSTERTRFDPHEAAERERQRREGVIGDDEGTGAYSRPVRGEGEDKEQKEKERHEVKILDWDREVRGKVRLGVVVGDPGLGKTWLLKWEAAERAKEAERLLRENGDLDRVTLP